MADFYTVKQLQDLLKVDRITIYRMLQDGRLKGVKIGHQWRFSQAEVNILLGESTEPTTLALENGSEISSNLPVHCIQTIQNLYSSISQMTALVVDMQGTPLTTISAPCRFCAAINGTSAGSAACRAAWRQMAGDCRDRSQIFTCHAGLNYTAAPVFDQGVQIGAFITGGFYLLPPDRYEESERVEKLAARYKLPAEQLQDLVMEIAVIPSDRRAAVETWPRAAALAVQSILDERIGLISRLQKIANLTQI
jgi:excisionase family DNA binding protein